jgi:hypothetical protein
MSQRGLSGSPPLTIAEILPDFRRLSSAQAGLGGVKSRLQKRATQMQLLLREVVTAFSLFQVRVVAQFEIRFL